jgi:hypothetical protein
MALGACATLSEYVSDGVRKSVASAPQTSAAALKLSQTQAAQYQRIVLTREAADDEYARTGR